MRPFWAIFAVERELALVKTRLHHLVEAIANGKGTDEVMQALHREEPRKKTLVADAALLDAMTETISLDEKRIVQTLHARLGDIPATLPRATSLT